MKYHNICVLVPFFENGLKNWHKIKLEGTLTEHRVHREIKRFCRRQYNVTPDPEFLKYECIYYQPYRSNSNLEANIQLEKHLLSVLQDEHEEIELEQAGTDNLSKEQTT